MSRRACVIGHPVAHSRSPLIHGYWLREHKIDGEYVREDVPPAADREFSRPARRNLCRSQCHDPAQGSGVREVETSRSGGARARRRQHALVRERNAQRRPTPTCTGFSPISTRVFPAGTGAAGPRWCSAPAGLRAALSMRCSSAASTASSIANRTRARAEALAERFGAQSHGCRLGQHFQGFGQGRSSGQRHVARHERPAAARARSGATQERAAVYDIVYVPLETPLLAAARARGNPAVDGLGMLLHQAVPGFERWFGVRPIVTPALRMLLLADLGEKERP